MERRLDQGLLGEISAINKLNKQCKFQELYNTELEDAAHYSEKSMKSFVFAFFLLQCGPRFPFFFIILQSERESNATLFPVVDRMATKCALANNQDKESVLLVIASLNEFLIFAQFACLNAELCYFWLLHLAKKMKYKQQSEFFTGMIETVKL